MLSKFLRKLTTLDKLSKSLYEISFSSKSYKNSFILFTLSILITFFKKANEFGLLSYSRNSGNILFWN